MYSVTLACWATAFIGAGILTSIPGTFLLLTQMGVLVAVRYQGAVPEAVTGSTRTWPISRLRLMRTRSLSRTQGLFRLTARQSTATDRTLVHEGSKARDPEATDETRMKHRSESKEVIGGPAGEAHAGTSRSPYDN